jgi:hypothetical protein
MASVTGVRARCAATGTESNPSQTTATAIAAVTHLLIEHLPRMVFLNHDCRSASRQIERRIAIEEITRLLTYQQVRGSMRISYKVGAL